MTRLRYMVTIWSDGRDIASVYACCVDGCDSGYLRLWQSKKITLPPRSRFSTQLLDKEWV